MQTFSIVMGQSIAVDTAKPQPFCAAEMFWGGMTFDHQASIVRADLLKQFPYDETPNDELESLTAARQKRA